jgi:hypothetical protein
LRQEAKEKDHHERNILQLKSEVVNVEDRTYPPSSGLFVSYDYFKNGRLSMKIQISKIDDVESGNDL